MSSIRVALLNRVFSIIVPPCAADFPFQRWCNRLSDAGPQAGNVIAAVETLERETGRPVLWVWESDGLRHHCDTQDIRNQWDTWIAKRRKRLERVIKHFGRVA